MQRRTSRVWQRDTAAVGSIWRDDQLQVLIEHGIDIEDRLRTDAAKLTLIADDLQVVSKL
jgi:hypothetical protein